MYIKAKLYTDVVIIDARITQLCLIIIIIIIILIIIIIIMMIIIITKRAWFLSELGIFLKNPAKPFYFFLFLKYIIYSYKITLFALKSKGLKAPTRVEHPMKKVG
jgi:hypothetical protein